jgi:predicted AAA+ superfamily ATPase
MALSNQDRVGKGMELLKVGLAPYVAREFDSMFRGNAEAEAQRFLPDDRTIAKKRIVDWDASALLKLVWESWNQVFGKVLGRAERSLVQELRDWRNKWAHQEAFSSDDTDRALDSIQRLLAAVCAKEADEVSQLKLDLRRQQFDQQVRGEKRKAGGSLIEPGGNAVLKPWREVIAPHPDVASGRYQQAEFAADIWQVHLGEGSDEYRKPSEFFRRTFLTESLKKLLVGAASRLSGGGGDPVVQLQTNFGGGKTHSMLALYHMVSGVNAADLPGVDAVMAEANVKSLPKARRVVLVGNKISPGNPSVKEDGTQVRTLWGELAWQLGGREAFDRIRADDERATNPGDALRELFNKYGPCLILIDEWVAYARQLHNDRDLPGGDFETQFSFAQALTESAKLADKCMLVISLPASDTAGSPHTNAVDDVEVGGIRGREALERLRNVVGRLESAWRPASPEEGFEIVRRRLFEPLAGDQFKSRDVTARAFADLYRAQKGEFPPECNTPEYEERIKTAFPIHPEIFDRLYNDWSTLVKFQRTRGVLRLMAAVIHCLWEKGDRNPMILPSTIPIDDPRVQFELTRYLSDQWTPIIERDVDGVNSLPSKIDATNTSLGKYHATRRVARTIYLGSAPLTAAAQRGLEDRRIRLGCVMPGEPTAPFGDALRYLASRATHLYQDGARAWYDLQPTVTKLAEDRAEQLKRESDRVAEAIEARVRADLSSTGDFSRVHAVPASGADVADEAETRLVVLRPDQPHSKEGESASIASAKAILASRGNSPRIYQNALVFLAADKVRLQDLEEATRKLLAWESILDEREVLNLGPHQLKQAESQKAAAEQRVLAQLPEVYQWLIAPTQASPQGPVQFEATVLRGGERLAPRVCKRMRTDETLVPVLGAAILRKHLDDVPLWRGSHVEVRQLVDDFAKYIYLPRLVSTDVLLRAIADGVAMLTWRADSFALADDFDDAATRYRGLRSGQTVTVHAESRALVVRPQEAWPQLEREAQAPGTSEVTAPTGGETVETERADVRGRRTRFYGSVTLDPIRAGRDAGMIAEEVIAHLSGQIGASVRVTLDIEADLEDGASDQLVRIISENCKSLKFTNHGFE